METERLVLRPLPAAAAAALPANRDLAAGAIGATLDDEWPQPDVIDLFPSQAATRPEERPFGVWVVIDRATASVIGDIGFMGPASPDGEVEIGYSIVPKRRRRGYAAEAVLGLVTWALAQPGVRSVLATTDTDNTTSQGVLERAGFRRMGIADEQVRWRLDRSGGAS